MKIVHVTNDLERLGGVQRLLIDILTELDDRFELEVVLLKGENEYCSELSELGIPVYHLKNIGYLEVFKVFKSADIVHSHLFPGNYLALMSSSPSIMTEHSSHYRRRDIPFVKFFESVFFRKYKKIICISNGVKESLLSNVSLPSGLIQVVNNGVDITRFSRKAKFYDESSKTLRVAMVGRLVESKDSVTLINAIALLERHVELHLAGDGPLMSSLVELAIMLNVSDRVFFHGQVNDIPEFLSKMDVYVQSSNWEGFGLAAIEAMAEGLPTLATNVKGLAGVVDKHGLFDLGDKRMLAAKIKRLDEDREYYNEQASISVERALEFSVSKTACQYSSIYDDVLKNAKL